VSKIRGQGPTFAGQIIETGTTSYRLAHARKRRSTTTESTSS